MPDTPVLNMLRERRKARGLSQVEVADRVGVSRQAISAIEGGRQVPSTGLSLHLARALGCSVEDLFQLRGGALLEARVVAGSGGPRVAVGRVDGTWVAHRVAVDSRAADGIVVGAEPRRGAIELFTEPSELESNVLVAGCAPLLGVLTGRLGRRYRGVRGTWIPADSSRSLEHLAHGDVHVAGLHLADASRPDAHIDLIVDRFGDEPTAVVNLTRWRQGLVVASGNPLEIKTGHDLLRQDLRCVRREAGSGAQKLLERTLAESGDDSSKVVYAGPVATGHAEVARLVRWGVADVGVAIEAAAHAEGLGFIPLSEERFDLVVPRARLGDTPVARLLDLIETRAFQAEASRFPGYDLSLSGHLTTVAGRDAA